MKKAVRSKLEIKNPPANPIGRIDKTHVDRTSEQDIAQQAAQDNLQAMLDAAEFTRRVRQRLGLTQREFAHRIHVSIDTIRNWEQGKRCPTGPAKTLLVLLDRLPRSSLRVLQ